MASEQKAQANQMRRQQLGSYGPSQGHWTVEAHHQDLEYRGIPHAAPLPKLARHDECPPSTASATHSTAPVTATPDKAVDELEDFLDYIVGVEAAKGWTDVYVLDGGLDDSAIATFPAPMEADP